MDTRETSDGGEFWKTIVPFFTELFPLFLEKWSEVNDRPALRTLEKELARTNRRLEKAAGQMRWLYSFLAVLVVWNIFLTIILTLSLGKLF